MADVNETKEVQLDKPVVKKAKPVVKMPESIYSVTEFAKRSDLFGTSPIVVLAALKTAGVQTATLSEAKRVVENYRKQEVRI